MNKNILIVLGNGFTMDFISKVGKGDVVDVRNLFSQGDRVEWVENGEPGFLSYKRCPNLWSLGVRPNNSNEECLRIIEDIITCAHVYCNGKNSRSAVADDVNIYIKAYNELATYLRYLFAYYNSLVSEEDLKKESILNWGWLKFFKKLKENTEFEKINIVTYNYDVFLERLLDSLGIEYSIAGSSDEAKRFNIIKPHGSISFRHKRVVDNSLFKIRYDIFSSEINWGDLIVDYANIANHTIANPIIPPAGDSARFNFGWSQILRNITKEIASNLIEHDECVICGLSYWHVDRNEIDDILLSLDNKINIRMVNPSTPTTLNAVVSSVFKNYTNYTSSDIIPKILN